MKVYTRHPGLCDAIRRAGHEPVLLDSHSEPEAPDCTHCVHLPTCEEAGSSKSAARCTEFMCEDGK